MLHRVRRHPVGVTDVSFSRSQCGRCLNVCDKSVAVVVLYFGDVCSGRCRYWVTWTRK